MGYGRLLWLDRLLRLGTMPPLGMDGKVTDENPVAEVAEEEEEEDKEEEEENASRGGARVL